MTFTDQHPDAWLRTSYQENYIGEQDILTSDASPLAEGQEGAQSREAARISVTSDEFITINLKFSYFYSKNCFY